MKEQEETWKCYFSYSAFCTELCHVANCCLEGCKIENFSSELSVLIKYQHEKEKFVDLRNAYLEAFSTFYSCSLRKKYWIEYLMVQIEWVLLKLKLRLRQLYKLTTLKS